MQHIVYNAKYGWVHGIQSTDFAITISISNTRGFAAFLTKSTYNNYIYMYYIYNI